MWVSAAVECPPLEANKFTEINPLDSSEDRVCMGSGKPGILLWYFPGLESLGKGLLVLDSSGNLLNSSYCKKNNMKCVADSNKN